MVTNKQRLRLAEVLFLPTLLFSVIGCKPTVVSDQTLINRFSESESSFIALSKSYEAGEVVCPLKGDADICKLGTSASLLTDMQGLEEPHTAYVKRNHGADDGLWLSVQSYGLMSMSSSSRGYVYLKKLPAETISNTLNENRDGIHYRKLKGNWFLFAVQ